MRPVTPQPPRDPLRVAAIAREGLSTFEFAIAVEVFGMPRPEYDPWYDFRICAHERGSMRAVGGFEFTAPHGLGVLDRAGTIVVPGWSTADRPSPPALLRKLRRAHAQGARLLSICSGAFLLAEAGLLDGRRASTHWLYADTFRDRYPKVELDAEVLYVDEGPILTSAGSAAGIDACLHLVRRDFGAARANEIARRLVVPPHRDGDQRQFVERPLEPGTDGSEIAGLMDSVRTRLDRPHTVESLAREVSMSPRNFARRFRQAAGTTPHRWLVRARVERAQELLETTDLDLERVAAATGFVDPQLLRTHFKRIVGTPPSAYRRTFQRERR